VGNATDNRIAAASLGTGSPNLLLYSLGLGTAAEPARTAINVLDITGSSARSGKKWRARATVTVQAAGTATTTLMANVTVSGDFAPGGTASCVTGTSGSCTLTSAPIDGTQTNFTIGNLSGYNMEYTGSNVVSSIAISWP
jgi:hypothetical protein